MAKYSEAQAKAAKKYLEKNDLVEIKFRVKQKKKEEYKQQAERKGESLSSYIIRLIEEDIQNDKKSK